MPQSTAGEQWAEPFRPLTAKEFERIRRLAYETFGLDLKPGKQALVSARLGKHLRHSKFRTFDEYCRHVEADRTGEALTAMVDALTTNYTSFLRESAHFEYLTRSIWPHLQKRNHINVWSAACATGEEPYSIVLALMEASGAATPTGIRILATDISTTALDTARKAIYAAEKVQPIPKLSLQKYFLRGEGRWQGCYQVKPQIRAAVDFARCNLVEGTLPGGPFDVVFCRNVMIYFDKATQERVVNRLAASIETGGHLFIGHAESLNGIDHPFTYVCPAIYRKDGGTPRRTPWTRPR